MFGIDVRVARAAWTVFLVAALLATVYLARQTLFLLVLATFLAYLVNPCVHFVQQYAPRLSRSVVVAMVFLAVLVVVGIVSTLIGERISEQVTALSERLPILLKDPHATERIPLPHWMEPLRAKIVDAVSSQFAGGKDQALPLAQRIGVGIVQFAGNLVYVVIVPILSFLLVKDSGRLHAAAIDLMAAGPRRLIWEAVLKDLNTAFARYIRALLLLSIAVFCVYGLVFSLLGVPYALAIAGIAAPLEFIPFVGPLAAAAIALFVAGFSGYPHLLWIAGFILFYRVFQDYVLNPFLMSKGVELHPVLVIVGLLAGEAIEGVAGMFLAIPLLAATKIIIERIRSMSMTERAGIAEQSRTVRDEEARPRL